MPLADLLTALSAAPETEDYLSYVLGAFRPFAPPVPSLLRSACGVHSSHALFYPFPLSDYSHQGMVTKGDFLGASSLFGAPKSLVQNVRIPTNVLLCLCSLRVLMFCVLDCECVFDAELFGSNECGRVEAHFRCRGESCE